MPNFFDDEQMTEQAWAELERIINSKEPLPYIPKAPAPELSAEEFMRRLKATSDIQNVTRTIK